MEAGRDVTNITNDPKILQLVILSLGGIISLLLSTIILLIKSRSRTMKQLFDMVNEKKLYKKKYFELKNGGNHVENN